MRDHFELSREWFRRAIIGANLSTVTLPIGGEIDVRVDGDDIGAAAPHVLTPTWRGTRAPAP